MKTIVQILVAILVVVACARVGEAAWRYYGFKDAVEQEVRFGDAKTTSQLHQRVIELASEHDVPLEHEDVAVEPGNGMTVVSVTYFQPIALVPAVYTRNQQFDFEVSVRVTRALIDDEP